MWIHLVSRVEGFERPVREFSYAAKLWRRLRRAFPDVGMAVLMPDHLHIVTKVANPSSKSRALQRLGVLLTRSTRTVQWEEPRNTEISNRDHLWRHLRYVALNPCRAQLVNDPLSWCWSTYRDLFGATINPWGNLDYLMREFDHRGVRPEGGRLDAVSFIKDMHRYVSSDPSVDPRGSAIPQWTTLRFESPPTKKIFPNKTLFQIRDAVAAAMRVHPNALLKRGHPMRRLFATIAWHRGWDGSEKVSKFMGLSQRQAQRYFLEARAREIPHFVWAAVAHALGDQRLRNLPGVTEADVAIRDMSHESDALTQSTMS